MFGGTSTSQATGLTSPTYEGQGSLSQSQPSMSTPHTPATPLTPSLMTPSIDKPAVSVVDTRISMYTIVKSHFLIQNMLVALLSHLASSHFQEIQSLVVSLPPPPPPTHPKHTLWLYMYNV